MREILVTGGLGYIGSHTVVELVKSGYVPVIIDNLSNSKREVHTRLCELTGQQLALYEHDFQDEIVLKRIFAEHDIQGIIHFAAFKAVGESVAEPLKYYANNVSGLVSLLSFLDSHKTETALIFSSSCTVYGNAEKQPITEDSPFQPAASPYGATKQMCETILHDTTVASSAMRAMSLRYFNPIGAHESGNIGELPIGTPANLVPFLTQTAAGLRPQLTVFGDDYPTSDGTCVRDYIHVVDLARAHIKALEHATKQPIGWYDVCNVGTGTPTSVLELIQQFQEATGRSVNYVVGERREGDITVAYADPSKAQSMLGWAPQKTVAEALSDSWRWQQSLIDNHD
jgi:UDP-glucose 4-epimerase